MGQRMTRPLRNFNVENRAAKALERQQKAPKAAPKHAGSLDAMSQLQQDNPEILSDFEDRNERLHENLKQLYIDTKDAPIKIKSAQPTIQLSRQGSSAGDLDLGVMDLADGSEVPNGRSSLRTVMSFVAGHYEDPTLHSAAAIAEQHRLEEPAVRNVLAHFKVMQLHIPKEMYKETKSMDKVMTDQLKASEKIAASFKLEERKGLEVEGVASRSIPGGTDTGASKT